MATKRVKRWITIGTVAAVVYGFGNLYHPTVVVGQSMEPTLDSGRVVWVDRMAYLTRKPQRGEVVVFRHDGATYIKRVYRAPGEVVHYFAFDGDWISPVRETSLKTALEVSQRMPGHYSVKSVRIPDDAVFVLGDNIFNSEDSRELGPIPIKELLGRAHLEKDLSNFARYERVPRFQNGHAAAPQPGEQNS